METKESVLEQHHQQREVEKAVEDLLQKEMEEREKDKEEYPISDSCQLPSEYLGSTDVFWIKLLIVKLY